MKRLCGVFMCCVMLFSSLGALSSCQKTQKEKFTAYYFDWFDTATTIVGYADSKEDFDGIGKIIAEEMDAYHRLYDIYKPYEGVNNLYSINKNAHGKENAVEVDGKIIDLLLFSKEAYKLTEGAVNIAMGSVLSLWHSCRKQGIDDPSTAVLPDRNSLLEASKHTNIDDLIINEKEGTVYLADPEMCLDVGAIAKGYATEKVAQTLIDMGVTGYILNVGGNVRTIGSQADGSPWAVGLENPDQYSDQAYTEELALSGQSVVTSGNYQRYYIVDGQSYHHIIDHATLYPAEKYMAVSVITEDSAMGDVLSTALFLADYEKGLELVNSLPSTYAMWTFSDGTKKYSDGFEEYCR